MKKKQWIAVLMTAIMLTLMVPFTATAIEATYPPDLIISYCCPGIERTLVDKFWDIPEGATFDFKSADPSIVKVDSKGNMTGLKVGESTTITMTIKDKDGKVIFNETEPVTVKHNATFVKSMKEPTCTEYGEIDRWYCPYCNKLFKDKDFKIEITPEEILTNPPRHGDTVVKNAKKATETAEGYTGDKVCKDCGAVVEKGKVIPKLTSASSQPDISQPDSSQPNISNPDNNQPDSNSQQPTEIPETVVDISTETVVNKSVFEQAKQAEQDLVLKGNGYSWRFSKETLAGTESFPDSFDAKITFDSELAKEDQDKLGSLAGDLTYFGFCFAYHGELLAKAEITISLGDILAGKDVTVYSVSDSGKAVPETETTVTADGTLNFETEHCSLWFISEKDSAADTNSANNHWVWIVVIIIIVIVIAAGIFCWWYFVRKNKLEISKK